MGKSVGRQADLHSSQDETDIHDSRRQPGEVVFEKASVLIPLRHVSPQKLGLREAVDDVYATQTKLSEYESFVNLLIDVLRLQDVFSEEFPILPADLLGNQVLVLRDEKVALVRDERGIREQQAERTSPQPTMYTGLLGSAGERFVALVLVVAVVLVRHAARPPLRTTGKIGVPEARLEQVARDRLEEHAARRPEEVQVRLLGDTDLAVEQELVVQRAGWHGPARDPQPAKHAVQPAQVELRLHEVRAGERRGAEHVQAIVLLDPGCGQERVQVLLVAFVVCIEQQSGERRLQYRTKRPLSLTNYAVMCCDVLWTTTYLCHLCLYVWCCHVCLNRRVSVLSFLPSPQCNKQANKQARKAGGIGSFPRGKDIDSTERESGEGEREQDQQCGMAGGTGRHRLGSDA